jgi:hypothetical protein
MQAPDDPESLQIQGVTHWRGTGFHAGNRKMPPDCDPGGHDLFASVHGGLHIDNDRAVIDKLWNKFIAAWSEGGKDDPNLGLLRLDPDRGQIWLDANNWTSGVKMLLGVDPKKDYKDNVAKVALND